MTNDPTTARARRRQAVADGSASDAVDRASPRSNPGGRGFETATRRRQQQLARDVAGDIDIEREGVGTVDRLTGMDVFLRSPGVEQWGDRLRDDFAGDADFVERDDVDPGIDAREISATPQVAQDRRGAVGMRARRETAAEAQWIEDDDLAADVGAFGVSGIEVREDRRSVVSDRARRGLAAEDPFAEPDDFEAQVDATGVTQAGLTASGARRRAGRQFEDQFDLFGSGDLDPETDIREIDGGFGLGREPSRRAAAADLDAQFPDIDIGPSDIELQESDTGEWEGFFEREVSR